MKNFIRCGQCRIIVAQDDTTGGFCRDCLPIGKYPNALDLERAERPPRISKRDALLKSYGLNQQSYDALLKSQNGVCAICKRPNWNRKHPHIDHDHKTGKTRGLLCGACNHVLGRIEDNIETARAIVKYLQKYLDKA